MTVKNLSIQFRSNTVSLSWDATLDYSTIFVDAEAVVTLPQGITTYQTPYTQGAVYQVNDSADQNTTPTIPYEVPQKRITIQWDGDADVARYELIIDGGIQYFGGGKATYSYSTSRLSAGAHTFGLKGYDQAGNASDDTSTLTVTIYDPPDPIEGLALSQSGAGNITATVTPPSAW